MAHGDKIDGDRIDEVVEAAVRQGQAPGVVAAGQDGHFQSLISGASSPCSRV
jgi:hypothetical protein